MPETRLLDTAVYLPTLAADVRNAAESIVTTQYMIRPPRAGDQPLYRALWHDIEQAPTRGLICRALLNRRFPNGATEHYNRAAADALAAAGWLVRWWPVDTVAHGKAWLFGRQVTIVGSQNTAHDHRTPTANYSTRSDARRLADDLADHLDRAWARADPHKP